MGEMTLLLIVFAHRSGFPLAHSATHQLWAVGFANIFAFDEDVEHSHVPSVIVQVELTTSEPREESRAHIPTPLKRQSVAVLHTIAMMRCLAILGLHEQQLQIIRRTQILWHPGRRYRLFPQDVTALLSCRIEVALVIINDGLIETALQFFQRHASRLRRRFSIVDTVR